MPAPELLTAAEFSAGTDGQVPENHPGLQPLLDGATRAIRRYCGWHVGLPYTETITLDGPGGHLLILPTLHVTAVNSITESGTALVADDDYEWSANGEIARVGSCWPSRFRSVVVDATHGFDDVSDLKQVIQQVVALAVSSPMGATRQQAGAFAASWATTAPGVSGGLSLLERDMAILNQYRLPRGA